MEENMNTPTPDNQPQPSQPPAAASSVPTGMNIPKDERMWGMFCHLAALAGFTGIPFANVLGPLIIWLIKKEDYAFVNSQGTESLNFQISTMIYALCCLPLFCIAIGPFLMVAVFLFDLIMVIVASISSNKGEAYRYPLCIRMIK